MSINSNPLVSIVATSFNQEDYCIDTLDSIKNQTYSNIELIIIDDCSSDDSVLKINNWIKKNNFKCIFLNHKKNLGVSQSLNEAIGYISGKYYKPIACDDILELDNISVCVEKLEKTNSSIGACTTDMSVINNNGEKTASSFVNKSLMETYSNSKDLFKILVKRYFMPLPSILYKTAVFDELIGYDESLPIEDVDFLLRFSRKFNVVYLDKPLVKYRRHGSNFSNTLTDARMIKGSIYAYLKHIKDFEKNKEITSDLINVIVIILNRVGRRYIKLRFEIYLKIIKTSFKFWIKVFASDLKINIFKIK